jgi:hypothetical protein
MHRWGHVVTALRTLLLAAVSVGVAAPRAVAQADRDEADWQAARTEGTSRAFQRYLERNPLGRHAGEAFVLISRLSVAEEWGISADLIRPAGTGPSNLIGAAAVY